MPKRGERMPDEQKAKIAAAHRARGRGTADKRCPQCGETKPRDEFGIRKNGYSRSWCRPCAAYRTANWHQANPEASAAGQTRKDLRRRFGLTPEEFAALYDGQDGRCAICGDTAGKAGTSRLFIDHCHSSARLRGLLCARCNTGLGMFRDDPQLLAAAIDYLANPPARRVDPAHGEPRTA